MDKFFESEELHILTSAKFSMDFIQDLMNTIVVQTIEIMC